MRGPPRDRRLGLAAVAMALGSVLLPGSAVRAQTWSPNQQAALAVVERSWEADLAKDASWIDRMTHPELRTWGSAYPVPRDRADAMRWGEYQDQNSTALVHSIDPVGIAIRDDVAVVHYYATVAEEDREGQREIRTSRCSDTLTRAGDTWLYLGWFCFLEPSD